MTDHAEREKVDTSGYEFRPADKALASALDTAERLAKEADQKFCAAFGGDGETSAYWLTAAIAEVRATLAQGAVLRAPASEGEAVAWVVEHTRTGDRYTIYNDRDDSVKQQDYLARQGVTETRIAPLFTHPAPATVTEAMAWQAIETVPKDGTRVLVSFGEAGVWQVAWVSPHWADDGEETWCVDDNKHGPYPLRGWGYKDGSCNPTHWMPTPALGGAR